MAGITDNAAAFSAAYTRIYQIEAMPNAIVLPSLADAITDHQREMTIQAKKQSRCSSDKLDPIFLLR